MSKRRIAEIELEIEELKDRRRLYEGRAGKDTNGGCVTLLVIGGIGGLLFVDWTIGLVLIVVAIIVGNSSSATAKAKEEVQGIDTKIKELRQELLDLKAG